MPEEPEANSRGLSALGGPRATGTPWHSPESKGFLFRFSSPKADGEERTKPPTTQSTATASVSVGCLTEPMSDGSGKPPDAGDPARSVRDAAPSSRNRVSSVSKGKGLSLDSDGLAACRAKFLDGSGSLDKTLRVVRSGGDTVSVRAYSLDQPDLVRALVAASEGRVRVRLVCDLSQAKGKTKMHLQVLRELAGVDIRLATGKSVRDAYMSENRDVRVRSGLQGLHHPKSVLVLRASSAAELVVGSTNWTTSSHANRQCGVFLKFTSSRAKFLRDWVADFDVANDSGITVQAAVERRDAVMASGARKVIPRQTPATSSA